MEPLVCSTNLALWVCRMNRANEDMLDVIWYIFSVGADVEVLDPVLVGA